MIFNDVYALWRLDSVHAFNLAKEVLNATEGDNRHYCAPVGLLCVLCSNVPMHYASLRTNALGLYVVSVIYADTNHKSDFLYPLIYDSSGFIGNDIEKLSRMYSIYRSWLKDVERFGFSTLQEREDYPWRRAQIHFSYMKRINE